MSDTLVKIRYALVRAQAEPAYSDNKSLRCAVQMLRPAIDDCLCRRVPWKVIAAAFREAGYADADAHNVTTYHHQPLSLRAKAMLVGVETDPELKKALGEAVRKPATKQAEARKPPAQPPAHREEPQAPTDHQATIPNELPQIETTRGHTVARGGFD